MNSRRLIKYYGWAEDRRQSEDGSQFHLKPLTPQLFWCRTDVLSLLQLPLCLVKEGDTDEKQETPELPVGGRWPSETFPLGCPPYKPQVLFTGKDTQQAVKWSVLKLADRSILVRKREAKCHHEPTTKSTLLVNARESLHKWSMFHQHVAWKLWFNVFKNKILKLFWDILKQYMWSEGHVKMGSLTKDNLMWKAIWTALKGFSLSGTNYKSEIVGVSNQEWTGLLHWRAKTMHEWLLSIKRNGKYGKCWSLDGWSSQGVKSPAYIWMIQF